MLLAAYLHAPIVAFRLVGAVSSETLAVWKGTRVLIRRDMPELYARLEAKYADLPWLRLLWDRRVGGRRGEWRSRPSHQVPGRRKFERRQAGKIQRHLFEFGWTRVWMTSF